MEAHLGTGLNMCELSIRDVIPKFVLFKKENLLYRSSVSNSHKMYSIQACSIFLSVRLQILSVRNKVHYMVPVCLF
jgi:hypothetical protein